MTTLTNTFAGGSNGTTITTGNSGGSSGSAFDAVGQDFGGTATYSNAESIHSALSGLINLPSSSDAYVAWSSSLTSGGVSQLWFRMYCYIPSLAGFSNTLLETLPASGFGATVVLESGGNLSVKDANGTTQITMSTVCPTGQWFRIEGYIIGSASAGSMQLKLFLTPDSATADETETSGTSVDTGGLTKTVAIGLIAQSGSGGAFQLYLDGLGVSDAAYLGPIGGGGSPHTATASLTVTPTLTANRTRGKYRTASATVSPSCSAARTRGKYRTAALAVTPGFSESRVRGHYRTGSLTVVPSRSVARVHGHGRTASLTVTPVLTASAGSKAAPATLTAATSSLPGTLTASTESQAATLTGITS